MTHSTTAHPPPSLSDEPAPPERTPRGIVVGTLIDAQPLRVEFEGHDGDIVRHDALGVVPLDSSAVGHPVALMFVDGDLARPIVTGRIDPRVASPKKKSRPQALHFDGRELVFEADSSLTLRCGSSSITLTREGRIILRGSNLVSHASGVNRIRGGTIKLN